MFSEIDSEKAAGKKELYSLLPDIDRIFDAEPAVLQINVEPVMLVGDIHGDLQALEFILGK